LTTLDILFLLLYNKNITIAFKEVIVCMIVLK